MADTQDRLAASLDLDYVRRVVRDALDEDGAFRDVTTEALVPSGQRGRGMFIAKGDGGVIAGLAVAEAAFAYLDVSISFEAEIADGPWVEAGRVFARLEGPLAPILSAERVALNFLQR